MNEENIRIYLLKNGKVIIGKEITESNYLENVFEFIMVPMMGGAGLTFATLMLPIGGPINFGLIDIPKEELNILREVTEYEEHLVSDYLKKVEKLEHPDVVVPETKSRLIV